MGTDPTENVNRPRDLRSVFADDPDMREVLELFVRELPGRVRELQACWDEQELAGVQRLAHQLKGAGGGYGFGAISDAAARLEESVASLNGAPTGAALRALTAQVESLMELCRRASAR